MGQKIILGLKILIILCLAALTGLVYFHQGDFTSIDLGRHLKNGQLVWSQPEVLYKNLYSFTEPDFAFVNHHWLAGVIYWWLYLIGGFKILTLLNLALGLAAVLIIFKITVRKANFVLASALILPVILLLSERIDVRPEMFSSLFLVLTYYLLEDFRLTQSVKKLFWLLPIFLFWVNMHIYFFVGLFLIGLVLFEQIIICRRNFFLSPTAKKFFYISLATVAACLLNPNFINGLIYPFTLMGKYGQAAGENYEIVENKSPFYLQTLMIDYNILIFKVLLGLLIISFILFFWAKFRSALAAAGESRFSRLFRLNFYDLAVAVFFSGFASLYMRNLPIFGLLTLPIMARNFYQASRLFFPLERPDDRPPNLKNYGAQPLLIIFLTYIFVFSRLIHDNLNNNQYFKKNFGLGLNQSSLASVEFYRENNLTGPIFNDFDIGSALVFWLYPGERVFVDNRPEVFSRDFFKQIYIPMQADEAKWRELSAEFKINLIYFSHTDGTPWARKFLAARFKDENWPLIYFDGYAAIMIKNSQNNQALIKKFKIDGQKFSGRLAELLAKAAENEKFNLADLARLYDRPDLALNIYQAILTVRPNDGKILAALGFLYSGGAGSKELVKSLEYFDLAIKNGYALPGIYNQMGLVYWNLADYSEAKNMWQKALRLDANNEHAKYYLHQANGLIK